MWALPSAFPEIWKPQKLIVRLPSHCWQGSASGKWENFLLVDRLGSALKTECFTSLQSLTLFSVSPISTQYHSWLPLDFREALRKMVSYCNRHWERINRKKKKNSPKSWLLWFCKVLFTFPFSGTEACEPHSLSLNWVRLLGKWLSFCSAPTRAKL